MSVVLERDRRIFRIRGLLGTPGSMVYWPASRVCLRRPQFDWTPGEIDIPCTRVELRLRRRLPLRRQEICRGPAATNIQTASMDGTTSAPDRALLQLLSYLDSPPTIHLLHFQRCKSWSGPHGPPDQPRGCSDGFIQGPWDPLWIFGPRILVMRTAITRIRATFDYSSELPNNDSFHPSGT